MPSSAEKRVRERYRILAEELAERGIELEEVKQKVKAFELEVPSWLFGPFGGGRFGAYMPPGAAPDARAKVRDAAFVHRLTGAAPRVAIHAGWDKPQDVPFDEIQADHFAELRSYALEQGVDIGAVNPTLFLEGTHLGSLSSPIEEVRRRLIRHCIVCCEVAEKYAQGLVTYWLPDGSCYPGQVDLWEQERRVREALHEVYAASSQAVRHLIEYKLFEPGTYSTVICDAGVAGDIAVSMGRRPDSGSPHRGRNPRRLPLQLALRGRRRPRRRAQPGHVCGLLRTGQGRRGDQRGPGPQLGLHG